MKRSLFTGVIFTMFLFSFLMPKAISQSLLAWDFGRIFSLRINDVIFEHEKDHPNLLDLQIKLGKMTSVESFLNEGLYETAVASAFQHDISLQFLHDYTQEITNEAINLTYLEIALDLEPYRDQVSNKVRQGMDAALNRFDHYANENTYFRNGSIAYIMYCSWIYRLVSILVIIWVYYGISKEIFIKTFRQMLVIAGVGIIIAGIVFQKFIWFFSNQYVGKTINIHLNLFYIIGIICIVFSAFVYYLSCSSKIKKFHLKN